MTSSGRVQTELLPGRLQLLHFAAVHSLCQIVTRREVPVERAGAQPRFSCNLVKRSLRAAPRKRSLGNLQNALAVALPVSAGFPYGCRGRGRSLGHTDFP